MTRKEKLAAYARKRYAANREKQKAKKAAYMRKWRATHPGYNAAQTLRYRRAHPGKDAAYMREHRKKYPEKALVNWNAHRVRIKGNGGKFTAEEWKALLEKYEHTCLCCGRSDVKLEVDHIIPINQGGSNDISNIQCLCRSCNREKGVKYADYRFAS